MARDRVEAPGADAHRRAGDRSRSVGWLTLALVGFCGLLSIGSGALLWAHVRIRVPDEKVAPPLRVFVLGPGTAAAPADAARATCEARLAARMLRDGDRRERARERRGDNGVSRGQEYDLMLLKLIEESGWRTTKVEEADAIVVDVLQTRSRNAGKGRRRSYREGFEKCGWVDHEQLMRDVSEFMAAQAHREVPVLFVCIGQTCSRGKYLRRRRSYKKSDPEWSKRGKIAVPLSDPKGKFMRADVLSPELRETFRGIEGMRVASPECTKKWPTFFEGAHRVAVAVA